MNNNIYLNLIFKLIKTGQIYEKAEIKPFFLDSQISKKNIQIKLTKLKKVIVKVKIGENKYLLIEDFPINFFLAYTIIVGDKTEILSFENELKEEIICSKEIYLKIKSKMKIKNLKKYEFINLNKIKFKFDFKEIEIIKNIRKFIFEEKKINLNYIHIVNSENIELFLPTIKIKHLKIAKNLKISPISLIENNYIKNSNVNIFETEFLINELNPIFEFEEKGKWKFDKNTNKKIFMDISFEIYFKPKIKIIKDKLKKIEIDFNQKQIIEKIKKIQPILISDSFSKIPLPLFKSNQTNSFIEIINEEDFKKITGREFQLNEKELKDIYLQDLQGNKAIYSNYNLNSKIENIIKSINNSKTIKYETIEELILKINYVDEIEKLEFEEKLNLDELNMLINKIKFIIKTSILISIEFNKIPLKNIAQNEITKYFESISNSINLVYENEKNNFSKKKLIKKINKITSKILIVIKTQQMKMEEVYFLIQIVLNLIKILFLIDTKKALNVKNSLNDFFGDIKLEIKKNKIDKQLEELVYSISLMNKISKGKKVYIILKNKKIILKNLLKNDIEILKKYKFKKIIKINEPKIIQNFPYSNIEILNELKINKEDLENLEISLKIKNKEIKINKDYFIIYQKILDYKIIYENNYFKILLKK